MCVCVTSCLTAAGSIGQELCHVWLGPAPNMAKSKNACLMYGGTTLQKLLHLEQHALSGVELLA